MNTASQSVRNILDRRTGPRDWLRRYGYAWIPLPLLFVAVVALWFEDIQDLHESVALLIALNLLLTTLPALGIAFLFARSFLAAGALGVGLFGCGALLLSCSGLAVLGTVFLPSSLFGLNTVVTIHNLNIWAASLCYLAGAALLQRGRFVLKARTPALLAGTVLALAVAALIALTAIQGWTPVFFVQGQGGSPERQTVLVSAIFAIVLTLLLMRRGVSLHSPFGRWFALALMLLAIGYAGIMLQTVFGGVHGWISRAAQYLGGGYMLAAAYAAFRDAEAPFAVQTPLQEKPPHPYAVAIALVLLATVLRVVMLPDLLSRVAFITFYPAVVLAALYGGLRAGAVATAVSAVLAASPWLTASGTPALNWPQDWPALLLFAANCLLISWIAEVMQQAQTRLRRVEADRRAELERRVAERTAELQSAKNEAELANEAKSQLLAAAALAEKALRESQERLAAALKAGKLGVHDYEPLTGRIEWDREVRRLWGVPEGEAVTYETFEAGIHPEDVASVKTALASALDPAGPHRFEGEYRVVNRADGSIRWVFADGDVTFEGAQPLRLVGTVQDITERKRAQERIQLLMREVNHRSKNMLSIVQAIARQTAASSPADFLDRFSDRIAALA
jgi:PAS domain S-box-containing protein